MRFIPAALAVTLFCSGCGNESPAPANATSNAPEPSAAPSPASTLPPIDAIELTGPGLHAVVKRGGTGTFLFRAHPAEKFTITPEAFRDLEARLSKYREMVASQARFEEEHPDFDEKAEIVVTSTCGGSGNAGSISVRWTGKGVDDRTTRNLNCNRGVIGAEGRDLQAIVATLPKPKTQETDPAEPTGL